MSTDKRPILADDLYRYELLTEPQISPNAPCYLRRPARGAGHREEAHQPLAGGRRRQPFAPVHLRQPVRQPAALVARRHADRLHQQSRQRGAVANLRHPSRRRRGAQGDGVQGHDTTAFEWSPEGTQFVCQFRQKDAAELEREKDEQKKKLGISYRHITNLDYKFDGMGYLPEEKFHIWTVDAATGEATQLTEGEYNETEPHWTPDGKRIVFTSNHSEKPDLDWDAVEIYTIPSTGGEMTQVAARPGRKYAIALSPNGRHVAYLSRVERHRWYQNTSLYVTPLDDGSEEATRRLDTGFDLHLAGATTGDFSNLPLLPPVWSPDGQTLYALFTRHGKQGIAAFDAFSDEPQMTKVMDRAGRAQQLQPRRRGRAAGLRLDDAGRSRSGLRA